MKASNSLLLLGLFSYHLIWKIPHAFQQWLSAEKTHTLCNVLPSFEGLKSKWEEYQEDHPETAHIVQPGLDKLTDYCTHAGLVPAYMLAMGTSLITVT